MKSFLKSIKVVLAVVFFVFSLLACRSQDNDDIVVPKPKPEQRFRLAEVRIMMI